VNILNLPPDTEYPAIGITSPSAGDVAGIINVSANATDNVGVAGVQFFLNGSDFGAEDLAAPFTFSWNTYEVSNGSYTLTAMARDAAGNIKMSDPVTFNVSNIPDTQLPTVSIITPAPGNVTNSITVRANASDNIAVTGVQFFLDGNNLGPEDATSPYSVVWNTASATAGNHTLSARARDAAGNMSIVAFVNVNVIINNPPVVSGFSVNSITANSAIITWTTNIPSSSQVVYDATTAYTQSTMTDPTLVTSHSMTLLGLAPGTLYHYKVVSGDANGSTSSIDNTFTTANLAASPGSLNQHTVFAYPAGKIVPWTSNPANGYDTVMFLAWKYLLNTVPNDPATGKPAYYSRSYINPNTQQMVDWDHNPAGLYSMLVESAIKYYGYSSNSNVMQLATDVALWHLDHGMTTPTDSWASVPYSEGQYGSLTYRGAPLADGIGNLEPDKIGELALAWLQLYKFNGNVRFRDAAIQAANVLASKIRVGTVNQSPWPFRVKASDGTVIEQYCSNIIPPIALFDDLMAEGLGNVSAYQTARTAAWNWMMTFPMQNNVWAQYFEDVGPQSNYNSNLNQLNAMTVATYLLEHPEFDPSWEAHVRGLITWVENTFGQSSFGSTTIREQQVFFFAMGSHTSRYASVNAMLYEKTGDLVAKEKAYRSFNWATYMTRNNGVVIDGPEVNNQWFSDGYGDYIRHFMNGLAAVPEWVPANQTRLLRSTSVVRTVSYGINNLSYTTSNATSKEVIHLNFDPALVTVNNDVLPRRSDLNQPGWTLDVATKTIRIYHTTGANITVSAGGAQSICPGESVYFVVPKPGIDYTYQWQIDSTGGSFVNLSNGGIHTGVTTDTLRVNGAPTSFYGNRYRCIASKNGVPLTGPVYELKFLVKWQGGASNEWEDSSNWSCNNMPDANTDVLVPGSLNTYPVISTNTTVHSIILSQGSTLTISPGIKLDIKGK
ncbi:MAG: Ig-like domain-containing protein, partial [Chitinophagales bacterium]